MQVTEMCLSSLGGAGCGQEEKPGSLENSLGSWPVPSPGDAAVDTCAGIWEAPTCGQVKTGLWGVDEVTFGFIPALPALPGSAEQRFYPSHPRLWR